MNRENNMLCIVFALGMEAYPFLRRVEVTQRWRRGSATYRTAFFEGRRLVAVKCGIGPAKAQTALRGLETKPSAILSVGTAGALAEDLRVGDLIVASQTLMGGGGAHPLPCSTGLQERLIQACEKEGLRFTDRSLITVPKPVFRTEDRLKLHATTGAVAVDMESHVLNLQARELGVPFACLRVISDDIHAASPPSKPNVRHLWRYPLRVPAMVVALMGVRKFLKTFRASIQLLPPVLVRFMRDSAGLSDSNDASVKEA
jgi:adenosylhomocysteine nucleosidase